MDDLKEARDFYEASKDMLRIAKEDFKSVADVQRQLTMARFAMHKIRIRDYAGAVLTGQLTEEQAKQKYNEAMENFDQILEIAVSEPERLTACIEDMNKGFYIPGKESL